MCWRLPIFPGRRQPSIVGTSELNCRVRNGNGWTLTVNNTNYDVTGGPVTFFFTPASAEALTGGGTPSGTRTLDTLIKSQVLYQLS